MRLAFEAKGFNQCDVSTRMRMSRTYLSRVLSGHSIPTLTVCDRLAKASGYPLVDLLQETTVFRESIKS